jgi:hypothetical protein
MTTRMRGVDDDRCGWVPRLVGNDGVVEEDKVRHAMMRPVYMMVRFERCG